jgi:hypothetical protein
MSEPRDEVRATVVVTPNDIKVLSKWLLKGSRNSGLRRWRSVGLGALFLLGMGVAGATGSPGIRTVMVAVPFGVLLVAQSRVQRVLSGVTAEHSSGDLVVDRTGFGIRRADGSSYWYQWHSMLEVAPSVDHILIREFDLVGGVIPRRDLADGDAERIVAFAAGALVQPPDR